MRRAVYFIIIKLVSDEERVAAVDRNDRTRQVFRSVTGQHHKTFVKLFHLTIAAKRDLTHHLLSATGVQEIAVHIGCDVTRC